MKKYKSNIKYNKINSTGLHSLNLLVLFTLIIFINACAGDSPVTSSTKQIYLSNIIKVGELKFAYGTNGTYYQNVNNIWNKIVLDSELPILGLNFLDNNLGFITSEKGVVFKTTNSGANWTKLQVQSNQSFKAISIFDENIAWVAGTGGKIFQTLNGGNNWLDVSFIEDVFWESIKIEQDGNGYVAGSLNNSYDSPILYITNDYGDSWTEVDLSSYEMKGITKVRETNYGLLLISSSKVIFTPYEQSKRFIEFTDIFDINSLTEDSFFISDLMFTDQDNDNINNLTNNFVVIGYRGHNSGNILINNNFIFKNNLLNYHLLGGITEILGNNKEFLIEDILFAGGFGYRVFNISGDVIELK